MSAIALPVVALPRHLYETLKSVAADCADVRTQLSHASAHVSDARAELIETATQLREVERAIERVLVSQDERVSR